MNITRNYFGSIDLNNCSVIAGVQQQFGKRVARPVTLVEINSQLGRCILALVSMPAPLLEQPVLLQWLLHTKANTVRSLFPLVLLKLPSRLLLQILGGHKRRDFI